MAMKVLRSLEQHNGQELTYSSLKATAKDFVALLTRA